MKNKNCFLEHVKHNLEDAFEDYYNLIFGFYDLENLKDDKILNLSEKIKNEIFKDGGKFHKLFEEIFETERSISDFELDLKKYDKNFNPNEALSSHIRDLYLDAIHEISKLTFMYGVAYGKAFENYLNF